MGQFQGEPRYFICHLPEEDRAPNYLRKETLPPISIELSGPGGGLSGHRVCINLECQHAFIGDHLCPPGVLEAAKRLPVGSAEWVDDAGTIIDPSYFFPLR